LIEKDGNKYTFLYEDTDLVGPDGTTEFSIFLTVDGNELTIRDSRYDIPNGLFYKEAEYINLKPAAFNGSVFELSSP